MHNTLVWAGGVACCGLEMLWCAGAEPLGPSRRRSSSSSSSGGAGGWCDQNEKTLVARVVFGGQG